MLTELLLTPDALSDADGRDGVEVVRDLKSYFFPYATTPTALISKLGGEDWTRAVSKRILKIENLNHRLHAMSLMTQLVQQLSVARPAVRRATDDESGWIGAAVQSSSQVPLGRIIVSGQAAPPAANGSTLKQFMSPNFWENMANPRLVQRDTRSQDNVLRSICTHSDWLLIRLPQIRGGDDDEIVTVKQILDLSTRLPAGFRNSEIDLQICLHKNIDEGRLVRAISGQLQSYIRHGVKVELTVWPENYFVNRELIGGEYTVTSQGKVAKPLWWMTMSHVAVGSRRAASAGDAANTWSLFDRTKAYARHKQIKADTSGQVTTLH